MKSMIFGALLLITAMPVFAIRLTPAADCKDLACVRLGIDSD